MRDTEVTERRREKEGSTYSTGTSRESHLLLLSTRSFAEWCGSFLNKERRKCKKKKKKRRRERSGIESREESNTYDLI